MIACIPASVTHAAAIMDQMDVVALIDPNARLYLSYSPLCQELALL